MKNIYDNGSILLGTKKDILNYIIKNNTNFDDNEYKEITEELKYYEDNTILSINYDNGMGWTIEYWEETDKIESEEN